VKGLATRVAVSANGIAKVARVSCPAAGGSCTVKAPKRVAVRIGDQKFWATVLAPKRLGAGKSAVVRVRLSATAVEVLAGAKLTVTVPLRAVNVAGEASAGQARANRGV